MGDNPPMTKAIALTRSIADSTHEVARAIIVIGCALALIAAGQALPSF